jgi:hypothetical protein
MIPPHRRAREDHNWLVVIDFLIVVIGVLVAAQVGAGTTQSNKKRRTTLVIGASRGSTGCSPRRRTLLRTSATGSPPSAPRGEGRHPTIFASRLRHAAGLHLAAALQSGLVDLIHPSLLFDLGFYYSEHEGLGVRYIRYATFVETEILPRLNEGSSAFYDEDRKLKPSFAANMDRLREWRSFVQAAVISEKCLDERLANPTKAGKSCRPTYSALSDGSEEIEKSP